VSTAGPQPGTVRASEAPLDLNLGPSQLSEHRWTSTWDLPRPLDLDLEPAQLSELPEDIPNRMPDGMPEDMPSRVPEDMPDRMPEGMPDR